MNIKQWHVYLVNFNPKVGTKPGKFRPCINIQPDHVSIRSSVIIPLTTNLVSNISASHPMRLRIPKGIAGIEKDSDLLIDQMTSWDHQLFLKEYGEIPLALQLEIKEAVAEFLELET